MRHVVYGTAGHIDHGKTTLVKALTGTDCDRLPEERERGITIDLGFAQLTEDDLQLHFVDVPGHERLVHTMIAGAAGIDRALVVVAADEGVMPQTREHLEVIRLMGVPGIIVAVTKADPAESDYADLVVEEVRELLETTPYGEAQVIQVSATTGAGLDALRTLLLEEARRVAPHQVDDRPYREVVDRVFSLTGAGTVVTGTSLWGSVSVGDEITILPRGETARIRRLHVHGVECDRVEAGERVAVNLVGLSRQDLSRGDQLLSSGPWQATSLVTVRLELLASAPKPLDEGDEVEVHALASRVAARIERLSVRPLVPGGAAVAQLKLKQPVLLFPGDRMVLRRPSPVNTLAGGVVMDAHLRRWQRKHSASLAELPSVSRDTWPEVLGRLDRPRGTGSGVGRRAGGTARSPDVGGGGAPRPADRRRPNPQPADPPTADGGHPAGRTADRGRRRGAQAEALRGGGVGRYPGPGLHGGAAAPAGDGSGRCLPRGAPAARGARAVRGAGGPRGQSRST